MNHYPSPWHPENEVERLLCSLAGVVSTRVVANPLGRLEEIHVLASPLLSAKQIVRNVQSALSAGLGIVVDRRIISVAQIRRDALEPLEAELAEYTEEAAAPPQAEPPGRRPRRRLVFVNYSASGGTRASTECTVTLRRAEELVLGSGAGAESAAGRVQAGARAAFSAMSAAIAESGLALEGASIVETHARRFVLVAARAVAGREAQALTGVAPLGRSPEEAAILASLQAANRWIGLDA